MSDDPELDYMRHEQAVKAWLEKRPVCNECGEHIADDYGYCIGDTWYCERCMKRFERWIEDA